MNKLNKKAYAVMNALTDKVGLFGTTKTATDLEEEALGVLMDIYPNWQPGDE